MLATKSVDNIMTDTTESFLDHNLFSSAKIVALEKHVDKYANEGLYDFDANLALLKIYQFSPEVRKEKLYRVILVQALLHHETFLPCFYLLPFEFQVAEPFKTLLKLAEYLGSAQFDSFWRNVESLDCCHNFKNFAYDAKAQICKMLALSYQQIPVNVVANALGYTGVNNDFASFLESIGWTVKTGFVYIPPSRENQARAKRFEASIKLMQVAPLVRVLETSF
jgi:translation initiation factor 3 subunit K|eukprot:g5211.t1